MNERCRNLIEALTNADLGQRRKAMQALEKKVHLPCLEWALKNSSTTDLTKRLICEIFHRAQWPEAVPVLIQQLDSDNPSLRAAAADALGDIGEVSTEAVRAGPILLRLLADHSQPVSVRDTAAFALGMVGYQPAWRELVLCLGDPADTIRHCAARALMMLREPESAAALEAASKREKVPRVQKQLAEALESLRTGGQNAAPE